MSQSQCENLLKSDVNQASIAASSLANVCACEHNVLTDMAYNLGKSGLASFNTFLGYMKDQQWSKAAEDLKGTLWWVLGRARGYACRSAGLWFHQLTRSLVMALLCVQVSPGGQSMHTGHGSHRQRMLGSPAAFVSAAFFFCPPVNGC